MVCTECYEIAKNNTGFHVCTVPRESLGDLYEYCACGHEAWCHIRSNHAKVLRMYPLPPWQTPCNITKGLIEEWADDFQASAAGAAVRALKTYFRPESNQADRKTKQEVKQHARCVVSRTSSQESNQADRKTKQEVKQHARCESGVSTEVKPRSKAEKLSSSSPESSCNEDTDDDFDEAAPLLVRLRKRIA